MSVLNESLDSFYGMYVELLRIERQQSGSESVTVMWTWMCLFLWLHKTFLIIMDWNTVILRSTLKPMLQNVLKNNFNVILFIKINIQQNNIS